MVERLPPKRTVRKFINACIWGDVELCTQMLRGDPDPDDPTADELTLPCNACDEVGCNWCINGTCQPFWAHRCLPFPT